jgi:hypothetical protein
VSESRPLTRNETKIIGAAFEPIEMPVHRKAAAAFEWMNLRVP